MKSLKLELAHIAPQWFLVMFWTSGCANGPRFPHTPAYSRPVTCPDNPVTYRGPNRQDLRQGDAVRCSYTDYAETRGVHLDGRVLQESKGVLVATPVEGLVISVHPDKGSLQSSLVASDNKKWQTQSDAQGKFALSIVLDPGSYLLVARDQSTGESQAFRRFTVQGKHGSTLSDLDMVIPVDPRLLQAPVSDKPFPIESVPLPPKIPVNDDPQQSTSAPKKS